MKCSKKNGIALLAILSLFFSLGIYAQERKDTGTDIVYHFGYGSNLSTKFLQQYCPNVKPIMKAYLSNYRVEFRFYSESRQGGISSIMEYPGEMTYGIIYSMPKKEMDDLDVVESVPEGLYTRSQSPGPFRSG